MPPIISVHPPTTSSATIHALWSEKDSCALRGVPGENGVRAGLMESLWPPARTMAA